QNQPRRDDFGLKIGKLSHRTSIKDGLGRHIGSCGPLNRNFLKRLARKTICFSRSVEVHEKVIGAFIEKYMFY
ncbi:IS1 family transposase, partial [Enterobacter cloacae complex sp. IR5422]|uniref:IS1 family transposase n=1 Tax=Enterobacter cloacae complex sp. IR5422 TaxID=3412363 RepID=UPI003B9EDA65